MTPTRRLLLAAPFAALFARTPAAAGSPAPQALATVPATTTTPIPSGGPYVEISHRPVNLADRLPANHQAADDASASVRAALTESPRVEWPGGRTLTLTEPVLVPVGCEVVGTAGSRALVVHDGAGFEVLGALRGLDIERTHAGNRLESCGAWILPGSNGASISDLEIRGPHSAGVAIGGSPQTRPGEARDALVRDVTVHPSAATSSFNFRIDASTGAALIGCRGLGSALDTIKVRVRARDFRVVGGRYTGAVAGDGIDCFAGGEGGYIGGGVVFEDVGHNGVCVKTDHPVEAGTSMAAQIEQYGLPRQVVLDGVIVRRTGGAGIALHRSDGADSDVAAWLAGTGGAAVPWLADVALSSTIVEDTRGSGLVLNGYNYAVNGVLVVRPRGHGVEVHPNARHLRLSQVSVRGAGFGSVGTASWDGFRLAGKYLWLSQCASYGVVGPFVRDQDQSSATRHTRYGFLSSPGAGSTHHFVQCAAYRHRVAPLAGEAVTAAKHTDGDYEGYASGTSLGGLWLRNNRGRLERSAGSGIRGFKVV